MGTASRAPHAPAGPHHIRRGVRYLARLYARRVLPRTSARRHLRTAVRRAAARAARGDRRSQGESVAAENRDQEVPVEGGGRAAAARLRSPLRRSRAREQHLPRGVDLRRDPPRGASRRGGHLRRPAHEHRRAAGRLAEGRAGQATDGAAAAAGAARGRPGRRRVAHRSLAPLAADRRGAADQHRAARHHDAARASWSVHDLGDAQGRRCRGLGRPGVARAVGVRRPVRPPPLPAGDRVALRAGRRRHRRADG